MTLSLLCGSASISGWLSCVTVSQTTDNNLEKPRMQMRRDRDVGFVGTTLSRDDLEFGKERLRVTTTYLPTKYLPH
jgi:hypothetical protein